jgi:hypothetical protein
LFSTLSFCNDQIQQKRRLVPFVWRGSDPSFVLNFIPSATLFDVFL